MGVSPKPINVFVSYAPPDAELRAQLDDHLALMKRQGVIDAWHDREILPGDDRRSQIDEHINAADVVLLLVSPSFIASDYLYSIEMARALERHTQKEAIVIPVIARPCDWDGAPFAHIQGLPYGDRPVTSWSDRDEAWREVARGLRATFNVRRRRDTKSHLSRRSGRVVALVGTLAVGGSVCAARESCVDTMKDVSDSNVVHRIDNAPEIGISRAIKLLVVPNLKASDRGWPVYERIEQVGNGGVDKKCKIRGNEEVLGMCRIERSGRIALVIHVSTIGCTGYVTSDAFVLKGNLPQPVRDLSLCDTVTDGGLR